MVSMALCSYIIIMRTRWQGNEGRCIECLSTSCWHAYSKTVSHFCPLFPFEIILVEMSEWSALSGGLTWKLALHFLLVVFYTAQSSEGRKRLSVLVKHTLIILSEMSLSA